MKSVHDRNVDGDHDVIKFVADIKRFKETGTYN